MKVNCAIWRGGKIMAQVSVPEGTSDFEVIKQALKEYNQAPSVNANWPYMLMDSIRNGIIHGEVKRYEVYPAKGEEMKPRAKVTMEFNSNAQANKFYEAFLKTRSNPAALYAANFFSLARKTIVQVSVIDAGATQGKGTTLGELGDLCPDAIALGEELADYLRAQEERCRDAMQTIGIIHDDGSVIQHEAYEALRLNWQLTFWRAKALGEKIG